MTSDDELCLMVLELLKRIDKNVRANRGYPSPKAKPDRVMAYCPPELRYERRSRGVA